MVEHLSCLPKSLKPLCEYLCSQCESCCGAQGWMFACGSMVMLCCLRTITSWQSLHHTQSRDLLSTSQEHRCAVQWDDFLLASSSVCVLIPLCSRLFGGGSNYKLRWIYQSVHMLLYVLICVFLSMSVLILLIMDCFLCYLFNLKLPQPPSLCTPPKPLWALCSDITTVIISGHGTDH